MKLVERLRLGGPNAAEVAGEAADEIERLMSHHPNPADYRYWEGRYRDEAEKNKKLVAAAQLAADIIERNLYHQREKVSDARSVLLSAISN